MTAQDRERRARWAAAQLRALRKLIPGIAQEAHTMGRIYTAGGEKLAPAEEFARVDAMAASAVKWTLSEARRRRRARRNRGD